MLSAKLKEAAGNSANATLYVDDVFSVYLYTGTGATQTITNGIDLAGKGGLVWTKVRDSTDSHNLQDTTRGAGLALSSNSLNAQVTQSNSITSFTSTGYVLGADTNEQVNYSNRKCVSWTFREAAKFFDIVTYTGTGSARTIAHNLGSVPGCIIVKTLSTSNQWSVYHSSLGASQAIMLQSTNAAFSDTIWNNTTPTSTVFSLNSQSDVNANGVTYVAYLFAHDTAADGIIQCGSATCDSGGIATFNVGWQPQYILFKSSSSVSDWRILDTMRGWVNNTTGNQQGLLANSPAAETAYGWTDTLSATGGTIWGSAGQTFIYMAIRMPNKPPTLGTQVYNADTRGSATATANNTSYYSGFPVDLSIGRNINYAGGDTQAFDRLRGNPSLWTNLTNAESAQTYYFDSNKGFYGTTQTANPDQLYWMFKRAPGFFDEICYTGAGANTTVAHNLTVVPELIITKARSFATSQGWGVFYNFLSSTYNYAYLQSSGQGWSANYGGGSRAFNSKPTSTEFVTNGQNAIDASGTTYVAYLFATLAGISKVGSYTGNGTGQAIACGFSAGARFVLIKRTDSAGDWYTFDSARGLTSGSSPYLLLNSTAAEVTGNNGVYASSGGFTLGSTASTTTNIAAATYIYLSIA